MRFLVPYFLLFIILSSTLGARADLGKVYEVEFQDHQTFYMYAGAKGTVRVKGIPGDVDIIQVQIVQDATTNPRAHILGTRNKTVEHSSGISSYIDINVEVLPDLSNKPDRDPIELKLKSFRKLDSDSYEIVSTTSNYIRTKHCAGANPTCALTRVKCRPHSTNCVDGLEDVLITYPNECEAEKAGAQLRSTGACEN